MERFKVVATAVLFLASCAALIAAAWIAPAILDSYTASYISSAGLRTPAFSATTVSLMQRSGPLCFGVLLGSLLLAFIALRRAAPRESKLYWITALACLNYHVSAFLLGAIGLGFFLLPRLANGT